MIRIQGSVTMVMMKITFLSLIVISYYDNGNAHAFTAHLQQQQKSNNVYVATTTTTTTSSPILERRTLFPSSSLYSSSNSLEEDIKNHLDVELMSLSEVRDDAVRREQFELFVRSHVQEEQEYATVSIRELPFIEDLSIRLKELGSTLQFEIWEKHKSDEFGGTLSKPTKEEQDQMYAFMDMQVQYKTLIKRIDTTTR